MSDQQSEIEEILTMAAQVGASGSTPEGVARSRGWLDEEGRPTDEGREMLKALGDQQGTRSVFR